MTPESPSVGPPSTRLRITVFAFGIAIAVIARATGATAGPPAPPTWPEAATIVNVARALDGETLLTDDGRTIRLMAIATPRAAPGRPGEPTRRDRGIEALQAAAHDNLAMTAENRRVRLYLERARQDRHGRQLAQAVTEDGTWLQAHLVAAGLARVETSADGAAQAAPLLRHEAAARAAGRGLWSHPAFRVIAPREAGRRLDTFQLVEGVAQAIEGRRPTTRFALSRDGGTLTVGLVSAARNELRQSGEDPSAWLGRRLRVRGWIRWQNGAIIDVTHAAQIEIVEEPAD